MTAQKRTSAALGKTTSINPENWQTYAGCSGKDTDWWFPTGPMSKTAAVAVNICNSCPVKRQCAQMVLDSLKTHYPIPMGIWAGVRISETHRPEQKNPATRKRAYAELEKIAS